MERALSGGATVGARRHRLSARGRDIPASIGRGEEDASNSIVMAMVEREKQSERGERRRSIADMTFVMSKNAVEFSKLNKKERTGRASTNNRRWCTPLGDSLKINTDGAFSERLGEGGWGYVIRDAAGDVIRAGAGKLSYVSDAMQAEVKACMAGVRAAIEEGMTNITLEMESLLLKQALEGDDYRLAEVGGNIYELKCLISGSFRRCSLSFVPRSCNKVAHEMAALGSLCPRGVIRNWNDVPNHVRDLVASDCAVPLS
ncbi:unnamed protein product [Urochloa humidicola]